MTPCTPYNYLNSRRKCQRLIWWNSVLIRFRLTLYTSINLFHQDSHTSSDIYICNYQSESWFTNYITLLFIIVCMNDHLWPAAAQRVWNQSSFWRYPRIVSSRGWCGWRQVWGTCSRCTERGTHSCSGPRPLSKNCRLSRSLTRIWTPAGGDYEISCPKWPLDILLGQGVDHVWILRRVSLSVNGFLRCLWTVSSGHRPLWRRMENRW